MYYTQSIVVTIVIIKYFIKGNIYLKWPSLPGTYLTRFGGFPGEFWLLTPLNNVQDNQDITNNLHVIFLISCTGISYTCVSW
jgi:hypothetical protein